MQPIVILSMTDVKLRHLNGVVRLSICTTTFLIHTYIHVHVLLSTHTHIRMTTFKIYIHMFYAHIFFFPF